MSPKNTDAEAVEMMKHCSNCGRVTIHIKNEHGWHECDRCQGVPGNR